MFLFFSYKFITASTTVIELRIFNRARGPLLCLSSDNNFPHMAWVYTLALLSFIPLFSELNKSGFYCTFLLYTSHSQYISFGTHFSFIPSISSWDQKPNTNCAIDTDHYVMFNHKSINRPHKTAFDLQFSVHYLLPKSESFD